MRITWQSSLDALRDLFGHALVSVDQHDRKLIAAVHAQVNWQSLWKDPPSAFGKAGRRNLQMTAVCKRYRTKLV